MKPVKVQVATPQRLKELGVEGWDVWECGVSEFDWYYDEQETCYLLEGEVEVETPDGLVLFGAGNIVVFPKGLRCRWKVSRPVRKRYLFG